MSSLAMPCRQRNMHTPNEVNPHHTGHAPPAVEAGGRASVTRCPSAIADNLAR